MGDSKTRTRYNTRRSATSSHHGASGSEYRSDQSASKDVRPDGSGGSSLPPPVRPHRSARAGRKVEEPEDDEEDDDEEEEEEEEDVQIAFTRTKMGRKVPRLSYVELSDDDDSFRERRGRSSGKGSSMKIPKVPVRASARLSSSSSAVHPKPSHAPTHASTSSRRRSEAELLRVDADGFIAPDEEDEESFVNGGEEYGVRSSSRQLTMTRLKKKKRQEEQQRQRQTRGNGSSKKPVKKGRQTNTSMRAGFQITDDPEGRRRRSKAPASEKSNPDMDDDDEEEAYNEEQYSGPSTGNSADGDGSIEEDEETSFQDEIQPTEEDLEGEQVEDADDGVEGLANGQPDGHVDAVANATTDVTGTRRSSRRNRPPEPGDENSHGTDGRPYSFRQRHRKVNYVIPPALEEPEAPTYGRNGRNGKNARNAAREGGRDGWGEGRRDGRDGREGQYAGRSKKRAGLEGLGWSVTGAELSKFIRIPGDDSDSDYANRTPRKSYGANNSLAPLGSGMAAGGFLPSELAAAAAGTPSNLGKLGEATLADADPLGVNMDVSFDEIGGLDEHIHSLKEMTLLPLLYPEVFQRFNVTPPRGVLFHGPPGTGKTLMARALAASCRSGGKQISFFMRKGADCLSKWVGEAERQLRLLFEEAKTSQPSIIFFDEIDGLAPVRSSKQDQIHASIVSTLLALMDGMDGRGQVVVIGATNRPDAVDPALRRPGRFDREFYFGLPTVQARKTILRIMTRKWEGWGDADEVEERIKGLATMTKGYGGADLRALCTEAALNAIQRRYPQIYKSTDRLLLKPESINVGLRDFMISIKKIVPSSARSSSSAASPLPPQFVPLLGDALENVKEAISRVMPMEKKLSALEEAEYEDAGGEAGALEKEMLMQSMQTLRIYRPRVIIHGPVGMGQNYVGGAALHFLEGYHIQSLELGTLMGDPTRTVEAAIVQLFVEAKRHQPSVIYIPSLIGWCAAVAETSRSTVRAMLDTLAPTDPILLLAVVDGPYSSLPRDVKDWFGPMKGNRIGLEAPFSDKREAFFEGLVTDVCRPPNLYADGMERKRRVLEELPIAPPLEPRQPTAAELAVQEANDQRTIALLKYRLGPILTELKRKFKRFCKRASEEYNFDVFYTPPVVVNGVEGASNGNPPPQIQSVANTDGVANVVNGAIEAETAGNAQQSEATEESLHQQQQQLQQLRDQAPAASSIEQPKLYEMDLERMHDELYRGRYLTPQDFLEDVAKILRNAKARANEDLDRLHKAQAMYTFAEVNILEFDPTLRLECERMAARERKRREEHRKNRERLRKEKEAAAQQQQQNGNGNGMVTRRSARANGLEPELRIVDPVQLERRLKRQRGEVGGDTGTDEQGSERDEEGREAKRVKLVNSNGAQEDDDRDPLDCLGGAAVSPHPSQHQNVRFAVIDSDPILSAPLSPEETSSSTVVTEQMEVTSTANTKQRKQGGFDPFLLNPASPLEATDPQRRTPTPQHAVNGIAPPQHIQNSDSFTQRPESFQPRVNGTQPSSTNMDVPRERRMEVNGRLRPEGELIHPDEQQVVEELMVVERTPTPLPDFHVDEGLLTLLRRRLVEDTAHLTVEQLEQLRATCLGNVWRHRKQWNRGTLIKELLEIILEFAVEVREAIGDE